MHIHEKYVYMQVHSIDHSPCNAIEDFYSILFFFPRNCNAIDLAQPKITILVTIKGQLILLQLSKTKIIQEFLCLLPLRMKVIKKASPLPPSQAWKHTGKKKARKKSVTLTAGTTYLAVFTDCEGLQV